MRKRVGRFGDERSGGMVIEYGLIAAGISLAIIAVVQGIGPKLVAVLGAAQSALH